GVGAHHRPDVVGEFAPGLPPVVAPVEWHHRFAPARGRQEQRQGLVTSVGAELREVRPREADPDHGRAEPPRPYDLEGEETERGGYGSGHGTSPRVGAGTDGRRVS